MDKLLTLENILFAIGALIAGGVWSYRTLSKQSAELKAHRLAQISQFAHLAYVSVAEFARFTATKVDDKIALALQKVDESLAAAGGRPLDGDEVAHVKQILDATHFQEKSFTALGSAVRVSTSPS